MEEVAYRQFRELEATHWWFHGRRAIFFSLLGRHFPVGGEARILDLGCGMGGMLGPLSRHGTVWGLDNALPGLRYCRERGFRRLCLGDAYTLPFRPESFDLVTLFDTVEHIDDDERVFREAHRVLRPGGHVFVTVPAYQFLYSDNDVVAHHKRRYRARLLKSRLQAAGFTPVRTSYYNTILFPVILPVVLVKKLRLRLCGVPAEPRSNISYRVPPLLNGLLKQVFAAERFPMRWVSYPCGHSLLTLARKA